VTVDESGRLASGQPAGVVAEPGGQEDAERRIEHERLPAEVRDRGAADGGQVVVDDRRQRPSPTSRSS
jgi:hypothetical protein